MKKRMNFKSVQTDIVMGLLLLISLTISIYVSFSIYYTKENLKNNSAEDNLQLMEQVSANLENYIDYMDSTLQVIIKQGLVEAYLEEDGNEKAYKKLQENLGSVVGVRNDIYDIAVVGDGGCRFIAPEKGLNRYARIEEMKWYKKAQQSEQELVLSSHVQNLVAGEYKWVFTLSKRLEDSFGSSTDDFLIIDMNYEIIRDLCEEVSLGENGYVYILDENGEIVYHPQQQLILSGVKDELMQEVLAQNGVISHTDAEGNDKLYTSCKSDKTGWTVVGVSYMSEIIRNERVIHNIYISVAVVLLVMALIIAVSLSRQITKPIKCLQDVMQRNQRGGFELEHVPVQGRNEISSLCVSYNHMIEYIGELLEINIQKMKEQQWSELRALQAQINPHFLYNTLDSIIWMIETEEQEQAIKMTSALARFFQQSIGTSEIFVTIREELEYTRQYLIIQRMRYKDKLDFDIQVNQDILNMNIIKMVLQPLVENSLYHGLKYKKGQGVIRIAGYRLKDKILIKVSDNGIGMDKDTLNKLFELKEKSEEQKSKGIGLANIQNRLRLYYGEEYGLTVDSEKGIGTTITVVIPVDEGK